MVVLVGPDSLFTWNVSSEGVKTKTLSNGMVFPENTMDFQLVAAPARARMVTSNAGPHAPHSLEALAPPRNPRSCFMGGCS